MSMYAPLELKLQALPKWQTALLHVNLLSWVEEKPCSASQLENFGELQLILNPVEICSNTLINHFNFLYAAGSAEKHHAD